MKLVGIPVRTDATLCDPGEIWLERTGGAAERIVPRGTPDIDDMTARTHTARSTPMNLTDYLQRIQSDVAAAIATLPAPDGGGGTVGVIRVVKAGDNLQAALEAGGTIALEDGATFPGVHVLQTPGTRLIGPNATLAGAGGPALFIPPGAFNVEATIGTAITAHDQAVIQVGENDSTQTRLDQVPHHIALTIQVPAHRGKRAFAINGSDVVLHNCSARDVYDPARRDSQGVLILNTPGRVRVTGGVFEAGSENILVGGAGTSIVGVEPADLVFEDLELSRPLTWKTDGINRVVKNLFELKAGTNVILRRAKLSGCWVNGQSGWALMITPRDGKAIRNVLVEDVEIRNAGGACMVLGFDDVGYTPRTRDLTFRRVDARTLQSDGFGAGRFLQWIGAPANITVQDSKFDGAGTTLHCDPGTTWLDPMTKGSDGVTRGVVVERNTLSLRSYGLMLNGFAYARNWQLALPDGRIQGNTFVGVDPAAIANYRSVLPGNTFTINNIP